MSGRVAADDDGQGKAMSSGRVRGTTGRKRAGVCHKAIVWPTAAMAARASSGLADFASIRMAVESVWDISRILFAESGPYQPPNPG